MNTNLSSRIAWWTTIVLGAALVATASAQAGTADQGHQSVRGTAGSCQRGHDQRE